MGLNLTIYGTGYPQPGGYDELGNNLTNQNYTLRGFTIRIISARKANQREKNLYENIRVSIDPNNPASLPEGLVDFNRLDVNTERDIVKQQHRDETETFSQIFALVPNLQLGN